MVLMAKPELKTVPVDWVAEALMDHLVLTHDASPDNLLRIKDNLPEELWMGFLIRGHYILHKLDTDYETASEFKFEG